MSATVDDLNQLSVRAQIERAQAETRKFAAEQNKLAAEAAKLRVDRVLAPAIALSAVSGAISALLVLFLRGGLH